MKSIQQWGQEIGAWAETKGWEKERPFAEWITLLHTELSEAYEEYRNNHEPTEVYFSRSPGLSDDEWTVRGSTKPEGIPIELADVAIRLFHMCEMLGIDLESAIEEKMKYNNSRAFRHGGKRA